MKSTLTEKLNNASTIATEASEKKTFTYAGAYIKSVGFNKNRNGRPYIHFITEDGEDKYADIHPALAYRRNGEERSPIFEFQGKDFDVKIVGPYPEVNAEGKTVNYYRAISPFPTTQQKMAYELYLKRKENAERTATEAEVADAEF